MLADKKATAGLLAQASAQRSRADPAVTTESAPVLEKIQTNTAETANNTARTEAKVDAIVSPLDALVASGRLTQAEADSLKPKGT
jgi:hypothetical protein